MVAQQFTAQEITDYISRQFGHEAPAVVKQFNTWLSRGDGLAVYENADLGSPDAGACKILSFGGSEAWFENSDAPERLPDTPTAINWRYTLHATYRGDTLPIPDLVPRNDGTPDAIPLSVPVAMNPRIVEYTVALDNYEPVPRKTEWGTLKEYDDENEHSGPRFLRPVLNSDITNGSIFIIDDGKTALPYWAGGSNPGQLKADVDLKLINTLNSDAWERVPFEMLYPFPVNPDGRMAGQYTTPHVIDYSNWMLGPRKCYHLKIKRQEA